METKRREVVTVFVRSDGRILLLRRSGRVGTYRGRWAGVSGYLEDEPLAQAYTELREEVGLERGDVAVAARGAPLGVDDPEGGLAWRVHPFLVDALRPEKIRLDWESAEMRWFRPEEVEALDTVPALAEALRRVL